MGRKVTVHEDELKIYWGKMDGKMDICCTYDPSFEKEAKRVLRKIIKTFQKENFFDITSIRFSISKREKGTPKVKLEYDV